MNNQPCMVRQMLINLNPDELHYYPFIISMIRCNESCNTIGDLFDRVCVPNKMEVVKRKVLNTVKWIIESRHLQNISHLSVDVNLEVVIVT